MTPIARVDVVHSTYRQAVAGSSKQVDTHSQGRHCAQNLNRQAVVGSSRYLSDPPVYLMPETGAPPELAPQAPRPPGVLRVSVKGHARVGGVVSACMHV